MIDLSELKSLARLEIIRHLETDDNSKDLIMESSLMKPIERVINVSTLKQHKIDKFYKLEPILSSQSINLIYIITSDETSVQIVINHVKNDVINNIQRKRCLLFYQGRNIVTDYMLETEGLIGGDMVIEDLCIDFIPLEFDLLSMEYSHAFRQLYIDNTHFPLFSIARTLLHFTSLYGEIPQVYSIGSYSYKLVNMWARTMRDSSPTACTILPQIGKLIIIDRNVDLITVSSSQLTFEGLISDVYGIRSGFCEIGEPKRKYLFNDLDPIFVEIRNTSLAKTTCVLQKYVKEVQTQQNKLTEMKEVSHMREYVHSDLSKLLSHKENLSTYVNCFNDIVERKKEARFEDRLVVEDNLRSCNHSEEDIKYIEWNIVSQQNMLESLKLMCLWSCTKYKNMNYAKKMFEDLFIKSYGFNHITTFANLSRSRFYTNFEMEKYMDYKKIATELELIPIVKHSEDGDDNVFADRYHCLSCKLVEKIICQNFSKIDLAMLGAGIHSHVFLNDVDLSKEVANTYAVFYVGGICHSEISALRFMAVKYGISQFE